MRFAVAFLLMLSTAATQQDVKVSYRSDKASVQDVVRSLAGHAGLKYNFRISFEQTDPVCRRFLEAVIIEEAPLATAMHRVLDPIGLRYEIEDGQVVLSRLPPPADPVGLRFKIEGREVVLYKR